MSKVYWRNICERAQDLDYSVASDARLRARHHPFDCERMAAAAEQTVPHEAKLCIPGFSSQS